MLSHIKQLLRPGAKGIPGERKIYSQCGEDVILSFLFAELAIDSPTYMDIGAHHPTFLNNTYLFYQNNCTGINIEPDPVLFERFIKERPKDINLNLGIGFGPAVSKADFYVMNPSTLNTFSKEDAVRISENGTSKIEKVIQIDLFPIDKIFDQYCPKKKPDIISIDVEGLDLQIVRSINLNDYSTTVFCVETLEYTETHVPRKNTELIEHFESNGFMVFADTFVNTIFINKSYWNTKHRNVAKKA
jgi:FkbM family methyltransferase